MCSVSTVLSFPDVLESKNSQQCSGSSSAMSSLYLGTFRLVSEQSSSRYFNDYRSFYHSIAIVGGPSRRKSDAFFNVDLRYIINVLLNQPFHRFENWLRFV